ncbi:MAG TPA: helix-turn-helix transcriptional regulator [Ktedonobacterales bacterium]|nr:helix-turn-helix transcriptional regulator [Ktedonobacterales bacterium]
MPLLQPPDQLTSARAYRASTLTSYALAVERVIQTMRAQLSEPLSLEEMAEIACQSPFHFNRVFRSITSIPPGEFLAALRLDAAKRLVLTTSLSVTDVCFDLGYTSLGTFTTRFKQLVGLSPVQLRQLADELAAAPLAPLEARIHKPQSLTALHEEGIQGTIAAPDSFGGLIFVGLFPRPVPQGHPIACTTLAAPGHFQLGPVPDGLYYLRAAALPWSLGALNYLLPESGLLVAAAEQPVRVRNGRADAPVALALRPHRAADPPILGVFPPLLTTPVVRETRVLA